jgi:hypothetical protein
VAVCPLPPTASRQKEEETKLKTSPKRKTAESWRSFANEVGIDLANSALLEESRGRLEVLSADWFGPADYDKAIVELRVRTVTGRVLCLDMFLEYGGICDASHDYDEVDGKLVEHKYDLSKPEEVARFYGLEEEV